MACIKVAMKLPHFLGLFICVAAATAFADENMTRNGVTWNATYEGDVFPSASSPVWSIYANSGSWTANNNIPGIFTQDTYIESAGAWQVSTGFDNPSSTGRTVEAKLKMGSNENYPNAADGVVTLLVFGGNRYMVFYIGTDSISMAGTSTSSASVDMLSNFNTIRVTHDSTRSTDAWKLYLNSDSAPIISSGSDLGVPLESPSYAVVFGDPSTGGIGGESQWDYISWTDTGAFAPGVPWNGTYEGTVFPSASTPAWSIYANSGSWTANNNTPGIFTLDTLVGSAGGWQVSAGFDNPLSTGRTVEAKLKLGINENYPNDASGVVDLLVFGGNRYMVFVIGTDSISMRGTSTSSASVDMLSSFNTLRVTYDATRSMDAWKLYVNSNPIPIITSGSDLGVPLESPSYTVVFSDPTTSAIGGESHWDYIYWTDAGAFDFVPPPPSDLSYTPDSQTGTVGTAIANMRPSITGTATIYSVSPALPAGLVIDADAGIISGTPTAVSAVATYTVTASNTGGSTTAGVTIGVQSGSYAAWAQGAPLDADNQLMYAIGGASSPTATNGVAPVVTVSSNVLSITAIVRTDDPSLTVYGQSILNLAAGTWITNDVSMIPSADQAGVPAATQRQIFSTPRTTDDGRKFLRLQTTLQP